jgi:hypothetical protein
MGGKVLSFATIANNAPLRRDTSVTATTSLRIVGHT